MYMYIPSYLIYFMVYIHIESIYGMYMYMLYVYDVGTCIWYILKLVLLPRKCVLRKQQRGVRQSEETDKLSRKSLKV